MMRGVFRQLPNNMISDLRCSAGSLIARCTSGKIGRVVLQRVQILCLPLRLPPATGSLYIRPALLHRKYFPIARQFGASIYILLMSHADLLNDCPFSNVLSTCTA